MEALVERRVYQRIDRDFSGRYSLKDNKDILGEFSGLDFSAYGIRVNSSQRILEGRALDLRLSSPELNAPVEESAQVVWQREVSPGRWQAGLEFYQPRLMRFWPWIAPDFYSKGESA